MSGYLSFAYTGNPLIDAILSALEDAGTAYHSTAQWDEPMHDGRTCIEAIQQAANDAANALNVIAPRNESSGVSPGGAKWDGKTYNRCLACGRASGEPCGGIDGNGLGCTNRTPAPQDSVRVGDGEAQRDADLLGVGFVVDGARVAPDRVRVFRPTTPAPAAGADGVIGECIEAGNDDEGQPRILIHTTREALRDGPALPYRQVRVTVLSDGAGQSAGGG